ncbi:hypothetical protein B0H14DRAFT_2646801 [Mycena olivaceomarginata]|nr:hypothetical protein B0H14DRAFT_2646801 [Mycena olivaceomarginata]
MSLAWIRNVGEEIRLRRDACSWTKETLASEGSICRTRNSSRRSQGKFSGGILTRRRWICTDVNDGMTTNACEKRTAGGRKSENAEKAKAPAEPMPGLQVDTQEDSKFTGGFARVEMYRHWILARKHVAGTHGSNITSSSEEEEGTITRSYEWFDRYRDGAEPSKCQGIRCATTDATRDGEAQLKGGIYEKRKRKRIHIDSRGIAADGCR